jgi:YfiH family protein
MVASLSDLRRVIEQVTFFPSGQTCPALTGDHIPHGFVVRPQDLPQRTVTPKQTHSIQSVRCSTDFESMAVKLNGHWLMNQQPADAIILQKNNGDRDIPFVAVRTADCLPILVNGTHEVTAIHAGWRGLFNGIIDATLRALLSDKSQMKIAVGPAISWKSFEVGPEVVDAAMSRQFGLSSMQQALILSKGRGDRWHIDLRLAAVFALLNAGVESQNIHVMDTCTYSSKEWHSYRREGKGVASNYSYIGIAQS